MLLGRIFIIQVITGRFLMTSPNTSTTSVKLTGRMLNFTRLHIQGSDLAEIQQALEKKLGKVRQSKLPVIVSVNETIDLVKLFDILWNLGLQPIGVEAGVLDEQALAQRVAIFPMDGKRIDKTNDDKPSDNVKEVTSAPATIRKFKDQRAGTIHSPFAKDLVYNPIVRSGQSINHIGGDLVLTHGIHAGAEAITDYSLHVYGKAEGWLVAGATGDKDAKIFCLHFNPSLVSVAGTYCLRENIPSEYLEKPVQVSYSEGKGLVFSLMNT